MSLGIHAMISIQPGSLRGRTLFVPKNRGALGIKAALGILPNDQDQVAAWEQSEARIAPADTWLDVLEGPNQRSLPPLDHAAALHRESASPGAEHSDLQ